MHVTGPDGRGWNITRRWAPWRPRLRESDGTAPDPGFEMWDADDPVALLIGAVVVLVLLLLMPLLFPLVVGLIEIVLLIVLLPAAVLWRMAGRRPWEVEVRPAVWRVFSRRPVHVEKAGGWSASGDRIMTLADEVRRGEVG